MTVNSTDEFTVVIVTYNSAHCLPSLSRSLSKLKNIIFVDNASEDSTIESIKASLPHAKIIPLEKNLGFGAANNQALKIVQTTYALLLNPDCEIKEDFFPNLITSANQFIDAAIIAPHLISRDGSIEINYRWPITYWKSKGDKADGPCCVGFVCGAVMLIKLSEMQGIGFFDEEFFLYYEDDDLCQRVFKEKKQIILDPTLEVIHYSRGSVRGGNPLKHEFIRGFHHAQSKLLFEKKYFGERRYQQLKIKTLILAILNLIPRILIPYPRYLARLAGRILGLITFKKN
jgi:N-acetylglucosaminyl-diphospho-decaprenol L-rhamnosyltransferase